MRFIAGFQAGFVAGAAIMLLTGGGALAQSLGGMGFGGGGFHGGGFQGGGFHGGFGGFHGFRPPVGAGIGVGAYQTFRGGAPIEGPTGARSWFAGGLHGRRNVIGFLGGGYGGYGGYGDYASLPYPESYVPPGGNAAVIDFYYHESPRHYGFYGGGGVFYADDGYSRIFADRPADYGDYYNGGYRPALRTGYAPVTFYRPAQHIFYLSTNYRRAAHARGRGHGQY